MLVVPYRLDLLISLPTSVSYHKTDQRHGYNCPVEQGLGHTLYAWHYKYQDHRNTVAIILLLEPCAGCFDKGEMNIILRRLRLSESPQN